MKWATQPICLPMDAARREWRIILQARRSLTWNLLFLSTGEQSLSDKISESGGTVKGGQEIRLCDIEADTGKFGLFEDLHSFPSGQAFSDHLRSASCKFYGTPIREFLSRLTENSRVDLQRLADKVGIEIS